MRLIDADALFKEFGRTAWYNNADRDAIAEEILSQMPTIDAVPVVRCAECKWFDKGGNGVAPICTKHSGLAGANEFSFCSYGEKNDE